MQLPRHRTFWLCSCAVPMLTAALATAVVWQFGLERRSTTPFEDSGCATRGFWDSSG